MRARPRPSVDRPHPPGSSYERIYAVVRRIPRGRVATYGQIALLAGLPGHARQVGYALHALGDDRVPWQRVVNAKGEISPHGEAGADRQRARLEREGVRFDPRGRIDLDRFGWQPGRARSKRPKRAAQPRRRKARSTSSS